MPDILSSSDFPNELRRGLCGGYLFFGPEDYLASRYVQEAKKLFCQRPGDEEFCVCAIDGAMAENPLGDLYNAMSVLPGFGMRRLVTVQALDLDRLGKEELSLLLSCCGMADGSTVLILRAPPHLLEAGTWRKTGGGRSFSGTARFNALAEALRPVEFAWETDARLSRWITAHFAAQTVAAGPAIASEMIARCGRSMSVLAGEIDKLSAYLLSHGRQNVTPEDLAFVCVSSPERGEFDFSNAVLNADIPTAVSLLHEMRDRKEQPELILGSVTALFTALVRVRAGMDGGMTAQEIADAAKLNIYRVNLYLKRLRALSPAYPAQALRACLAADSAVKQSQLDSYAVIERLLLRL